MEPLATSTTPAPPTLEGPPGETASALRHAATRLVVLAALVVAGGLLFSELVTLIAAGIIAIILALAISSIANPLERRGLPRPLAALIGLLTIVSVVAGVLALVLPPIVSEVQHLVDNLPTIVNQLAQRLSSLTGGSSHVSEASVQRSLRAVTQDPTRLLGPLASVGLGLAGVLSSLIVVVITAFYMAAHPRPLIDGFIRLFPPPRRPWAAHLLERIYYAWIGWMKGVLVDMAVTGVLMYIGLVAIGLDYAILFAALGCLLVVVPYFGSIAGAIPPVLLALTHSPQLALITLGVYLIVQQIEGNVIVPVVMARMVELHPAVIAVGVVVVSQLFGIAGLFVAVPIISAVTILVDELWVRPQEEHSSGNGRGKLVRAARSGY